jgi:uncharacterized SAM-binding protein YcdF (DUF218 family)
MIWEIGTVLKHVVLPPLGFAWLFALAWVLLRRRPRTSRWLLGAGLLLVYLSAIPLASAWLAGVGGLDTAAATTAKPQAIVVLGAGRGLIIDARDQVISAAPSSPTLERMLTGAQLQKNTGLPLLVSGGSVDGRAPTEAAVMRDGLRRDFGVPVRWVEDRSRNTVENARFSAALLRADGVSAVILVTSGFHLKRARMLFEAQGIAVQPWAAQTPVPAVDLPHGTRGPVTWRDFWPSTRALDDTFMACNEIAGIAYARILGAGTAEK